MQIEFGFVGSVTLPWVRPAVMSFRPYNSSGWEVSFTAAANKRVTLESWLMWHYPLNGGAR